MSNGNRTGSGRIARLLVVTSAAALAFTACGGGDSGSGPSGPPAPTAAQVVVVSGDNQRARITRALPSPIVVRALSSSGSPVSGATVSFSATGGTVSPSSATTDAAGSASVNWTLGATAGVQQLTVRLANGAGSPVTVTATADPALAVSVQVVDGQAQQVVVGTPASVAPTVRVVDGAGAPVAGVRLRFTATGSTIAVAEPVTDADGRATVGSWTMGGSPGSAQLTVALADQDVVATGVLPTFSATVVPTGGVATGPARTYAISSGVATAITDTVTGWRLMFPSGGSGTLSVARVVGGPSLPDPGAIRATVSYSGAERVELAVVRPAGGDVDALFYGTVPDVLTSGPDSVRWWGVPPVAERGDTVVFLLRPATSSARRAAVSASIPAAQSTTPRVQAYATVVQAPGPGLTRRAQFRAGTVQTIDWWIANLQSSHADRLRAAVDANPYAVGFASSGEAYYWYSLFTGWTPTLHYISSRSDVEHQTRHETTHYVTHMLVGTARYNALVASAPPSGHEPGRIAVGFRGSLIEEYSHFAEFLMTGALDGYDLRSLSGTNNVRDLMDPRGPDGIDFPSLEGFGAAMLAALTRTGSDTLVFDHFAAGSRTRSPALGVGTSALLGTLAGGPRTPNELREALVPLAGSAEALAAVLEPIGWSYNGMGRLLDPSGNPITGAVLASLVKVGTTEYALTRSTPTGTDGRFWLPRIYPGTSTLRMYRPAQNGGTDSVDVGTITVPWERSTADDVDIGDVRQVSPGWNRIFLTLGPFLMQNTLNPGYPGACFTNGGGSNWYGTQQQLFPLVWTGGDFSTGGTLNNDYGSWRTSQTLQISGTIRPGNRDTLWVTLEGTNNSTIHDRRWEDGDYVWKLGRDMRSSFRLRDVPIVPLGSSASANLTGTRAMTAILGASLYYYNMDWSHPEFSAQCQSSTLDPTRVFVNVYFDRN
jgi:hypothetical protein